MFWLTRVLLPLSAAVLACWTGAARAQLTAAGDALRLELSDCEDVTAASVRELVVLEVAPRPVLTPESTQAAATRARMTCRAGVATIVVEDVGRSAPLQLEVALNDLTRSARPRELALAMAELIATSYLQRQQPTAAEGNPERVSAGANTAEVSVRSYEASDPRAVERSGAQLWLGGGVIGMAEPKMIGPTAALGAVVYGGAFAATADLRFEHAQLTRDYAALQISGGSLALAPAWRIPMQRLYGTSAELLLGAGLRAGLARLRGISRDPSLTGSAVTGFWLAPCVQLAMHVRLARRWALRIGVDAAYVTRTLRGLDANQQTLLELRKLSLGAQLGIVWDIRSGH